MSGRGRASSTQTLIAAMRDILEAIQPCSVRAVAYQLFTRRPIPSMSTANVARVSRLLVIAREEGTIAWDPSGMGMSELDLPRRLARYSSNDPAWKGVSDAWVAGALANVRLEVRRVALTEEDTAALGAASSFLADDKVTDSRYTWFVEHYGTSCWELDALSPVVLRERVEAAIMAELDPIAWGRYSEAERLERESIAATVQSWTSILQPDQKYPSSKAPPGGWYRAGGRGHNPNPSKEEDDEQGQGTTRPGRPARVSGARRPPAARHRQLLADASMAELEQLIAVLEVEVRRRKVEPTVTLGQSNEAWLRGQLQTLEQAPAQAPAAPLARLTLHFHNDDGPGIVVVAAEVWSIGWRAQFGEAGKGGHATITDIHGRVVHVNLEYVAYVEIEPAEAAR